MNCFFYLPKFIFWALDQEPHSRMAGEGSGTSSWQVPLAQPAGHASGERILRPEGAGRDVATGGAQAGSGRSETRGMGRSHSSAPAGRRKCQGASGGRKAILSFAPFGARREKDTPRPRVPRRRLRRPDAPPVATIPCPAGAERPRRGPGRVVAATRMACRARPEAILQARSRAFARRRRV